MSEQRRSRREFLKTSSMAVAGAALVPVGDPERGEKPLEKKVLNHNPRMGYRRLGKTGIMISEVSLGGHGSSGLENRVAVLERAAELGMNYLDTNIVEECAEYGKALRGKRDRWHIGFASWPQKLTEEYEEHLSKEHFIREIEGRLKDYGTEMLDLWRPVGATWGEGQKKQATMLMVSRKTLDMVVEVFEKMRTQGKVRWLGISAHNPKVFHRVLEHYPQFSVILFPYLFLTREFGGEGLLSLASKKDVGVIGIKPFGAGTTFGLRPKQIEGTVDRRAHVLVKEMLGEPRISAIVPGVSVPEQLDENVRGSYERDRPAAPEEKQALRECTENFHACLTPEYQWLRRWETV